MLASGIVLGVAAGWLTGGRLARLADLEISWWPLIALGIALRLAAPSLGEPLVVWIASFGLIALVAIVNVRLPGMWLIAGGALMNLLVVVVNSAMPVEPTAAASLGVRIPADGLHRELRETDGLQLLVDRIPVPIIRHVYSAGDFVLAIGGFWLPFRWMRTR